MTENTLMMVTYNRLELTKRTLISLVKSTTIPYTLVIVDNGSSDGTIEYLQGLKDTIEVPVELILLPENKGIAIGRNIALKRADDLKTKWYCTIDNDVEMPDGWLEECIDIMKANPTYNIGVSFEDKKYPLVTKNGFTFQEIPGNLGTACAVFSSGLHKGIGFFKTDYPSNKYASEDADYGARGRAGGFKFGYLTRPGIHFGGVNEDKVYRKWKDECHAKNLKEFRQNCSLYFNNKKPIYLPYKDN